VRFDSPIEAQDHSTTMKAASMVGDEDDTEKRKRTWMTSGMQATMS